MELHVWIGNRETKCLNDDVDDKALALFNLLGLRVTARETLGWDNKLFHRFL